MADHSSGEDELIALRLEVSLLKQEARQSARVKRMWQKSNERLKKAREEQLALQKELEAKIQEIEKASKMLENIASNDMVIIENMSEGVMITSPAGLITQVNPAFEKMTGYCAEQVKGKNPSILNSGEHGDNFFADMWDELLTSGSWKGEIVNRKADGETYIQHTSIAEVHDWNGSTINYVTVLEDVSEQRRYQQELRALALYDDLTGLVKRRLFKEQVNTALHMARRRDIVFAILFIDLDGFKPVNDNYGHEAGDYVLSEFGTRLRDSLREDDEACRFGGDEFTMLLSMVESTEDAKNAALRLLDNLLQPISWKGHEISVGASIGIALYPKDGEDYQTLIKNADAQMYRAKQKGKGKVHFRSSDFT